MKERHNNIGVFFIKMLLLAFLVLLITDVIPVLLTSSLFKNKYGYEVIAEVIMILIIVIILILHKNSYVFTQPKEVFYKSIKNGGVLLVIALILLLQNISTLENVNIGTIINLLLYCTAIGAAEELLCRGWIQNEFIERFGGTRKKVIESIIFSSFIFGVMHFANILAGQTLLETILQVLQATSSGFLFGAIYYKTGNIWSTIFLHSFYDFAIMLGEASNYRDCTTLANPSLALTIYGYLSSLVIIGLYTLSGIKLLHKDIVEKRINNELFDGKKSSRKINIAIIILFILLLIPIYPSTDEEYTVCYKYDDYKIEDEYEIRYANKYNFELTDKENKVKDILYINDYYALSISSQSSTSVVLIENVNDFIVVDNNDKYIVLIEQNDLISNKLYYLEINKNKLSNDIKYFNNLKKDIVELMAPDFVEMGYIYLIDDNTSYPIIKNSLNDLFIIRDKDNINKIVY